MARAMIQEEMETDFTYQDPNFESINKDANQLILGSITSSSCSVKLNEVNVDPVFLNEDSTEPVTKKTGKRIGMTDLFEQLPTFPTLSENPLDHFQYMYTYDSPTPEQRTASETHDRMDGLSAINGHARVNSSNTSNPITWSQNFGYPEMKQSNSNHSSATGSLNRPMTWSNLFQGESEARSPIHKSTSNTSLPKSINYNYDSVSRDTALATISFQWRKCTARGRTQ